jgi:hypothetical protein
MAIRAFASLRNELRRIEALNDDDAVTATNFDKWRASLKAAVESCYANPITEAFGTDLTLDWATAARANVRRSVAPPVSCNKGDFQLKVRRAALEDMIRPAFVLLKSNKKGAVDKALAGLRTCIEASCANLIRVFADQTDDSAAMSGASGKLRVLAYALETKDPRAVIARFVEAVDPTHLLHLELATFLPAARAASHAGSIRFHQNFDAQRPVRVTSLTVVFNQNVTAPPPIQTVFVNEQLVDAFWDWKDEETTKKEEQATATANTATTPEKKDAAAKGGDDKKSKAAKGGAEGDAKEPASPKPTPTAAAPQQIKRTIKFAKAQQSVRSWSVVIGSEQIVSVEAEVDVEPTVILPNIAAMNGNTVNTAEVIVNPGGLTTAPLLRDVVTAALRHFSGTTSQEKVYFTVQHAAADLHSTTVYVGAAHGAAKSTNFTHAGATVHICEAPELAAKGGAVHAKSVALLGRKSLGIIGRFALANVIVFALLHQVLRLRGLRLSAAMAAFVVATSFAVRYLTRARRLLLGGPLPHVHGRSTATTKRIIAVLAHALAKAGGTSSNASRTALLASLRTRILPFMRWYLKDLEGSLASVTEGRAAVGDLKPDVVAAMGVAPTFAGEDETFMRERAQYAALIYSQVPGLADQVLPSAIAKDVLTACKSVPAHTAAAVDVIVRQAALLSPDVLLRLAGRCDAAATATIPPTTLQRDVTGLRTVLFACDRSGTVANIEPEEAKANASLLFTVGL